MSFGLITIDGALVVADEITNNLCVGVVLSILTTIVNLGLLWEMTLTLQKLTLGPRKTVGAQTTTHP